MKALILEMVKKNIEIIYVRTFSVNCKHASKCFFLFIITACNFCFWLICPYHDEAIFYLCYLNLSSG